MIYKIIKTIKTFSRKVILFLRKILNMKRPFYEFSPIDLANIERILDNLSNDNELLERLPYCKRPVNQSNYAFLEYSKLQNVSYDDYLQALQNPIISFVINQDFTVTIRGLNPVDEQTCKNAIVDYLRSKNFI